MLKILIPLIIVQFFFSQSFKEEQLRFPRVKTAFEEKRIAVDSLLKNLQLHKNSLNIFIRAFKNEKRLELWGKNKTERQYRLIKIFPFCEVSGDLGPKRQEGDGQIPEGVYLINHFNPESNFYLSLGINYPNRSDAILGKKGKLGGEIYIHGNCVTIGCIPITDDLIKVLYVIAVEARNSGQQEISVYIFPTMLDDVRMKALEARVGSDSLKVMFWNNLAPIYKDYEVSKIVKPITIDAEGRYHIQ